VGTISSDGDADTESPLPTRILHIFHPPTSTSPNTLDHILNLSLSPRDIANTVNVQIQEAFWRLFSPSINGLRGLCTSIGM
jgi:hypothetical protein